MTVSTFLRLYGVALAAFLLLDGLWLGVVARSFYARHLGHMMRPAVNWAAAVVFYLLFIAGVVVLAVAPALREGGGVPRAAALGALLGLVAYAAYDLTNLATLRGFPLLVAVVDMVWGTALCASVASATVAVATALEW